MTTTWTRPKADGNHAAADLFPMIAEPEFEALKRDIAENGQKQPIIVVDGEIVDGRNRLRACEELGITPIVRNMTAAEAGDVFTLVMSLNFHRRHLKPHEKGAALAAWLQRQGGGKQKAGRPKKESSEPRTISLTKAAEVLGIPKQTASDHLKAADDYAAASPDLKAKVDAGEMTAKAAAKATAKSLGAAAPAARKPAERSDDSIVSECEQRIRRDVRAIVADRPSLRTRVVLILKTLIQEVQG